jgi:ABC-type methionine transport system permease subunit
MAMTFFPVLVGSFLGWLIAVTLFCWQVRQSFRTSDSEKNQKQKSRIAVCVALSVPLVLPLLHILPLIPVAFVTSIITAVVVGDPLAVLALFGFTSNFLKTEPWGAFGAALPFALIDYLFLRLIYK